MQPPHSRQAQGGSHGGTAIVNCNVLDVRSGRVTPDAIVIIVNNKIQVVGSRKALTECRDLEILDAGGHWLVPGLIDLHVHILGEPDPELAKYFQPSEPELSTGIRAVRNLSECLDAGVTLVRDAGSYEGRSIKLRQALNRDIVTGPRLVACGRLITRKGAHGAEVGREVEGLDEIQSAVHEEINDGADYIKVVNDPPAFSTEELKIIVQESHSRQKKVACHAFGQEAVAMALQAGVDTIEHGTPFDEHMASQMIQTGVIIVPTYVCAVLTCRDPTKSLIEPGQLETYEEWMAAEQRNLPLAFRAGVKTGAGSDAGYPPLRFNSVASEVEFLAGYGASPIQALQAATLVGAEAIGLSGKLGSIHEGALADMILVPQNPLKDLGALREIELVMLNGQVVRGKL